MSPLNTCIVCGNSVQFATADSDNGIFEVSFCKQVDFEEGERLIICVEFFVLNQSLSK